MHDRRIDGTAFTFGNAGALFMNAMTWYDHETGSIWSQPWGRGIRGELKGVSLHLLPSQLSTWGEWKKAHPDSLLMINDLERFNSLYPERALLAFKPDFVIGLVLGGTARAYSYPLVQESGTINDRLGDTAVVVWARPDGYRAYIRRVGDRELTFVFQDGQLVDRESGSTWDPERALATAGPLQGESLQPVPSFSAYDWAFKDFYPQGTFYTPQDPSAD